VVKQPGIAELAHTAEGTLTTHREAGQPLSKEQGSELLGLLDEIASRLSALDAAAAGPARPLAEEPLETLRVEIQEMDSLLRTVTEAGVAARRRTQGTRRRRPPSRFGEPASGSARRASR